MRVVPPSYFRQVSYNGMLTVGKGDLFLTSGGLSTVTNDLVMSSPLYIASGTTTVKAGSVSISTTGTAGSLGEYRARVLA